VLSWGGKWILRELALVAVRVARVAVQVFVVIGVLLNAAGIDVVLLLRHAAMKVTSWRVVGVVALVAYRLGQSEPSTVPHQKAPARRQSTATETP
jgi:uncharacterized membrane protein YdcZ (DUF606 family)